MRQQPDTEGLRDTTEHTARFLTPAGWVTGNVRIPNQVRILDALNNHHEFVPLTNVFFEGRLEPVPFFALHLTAVLMISFSMPENPESAHVVGKLIDHDAIWLLNVGQLKGRIAVKEGIRLSDYLCLQSRFIVVRDCHYRIKTPLDHAPVEEHAPLLFLNSQAVIGVSERP